MSGRSTPKLIRRGSIIGRKGREAEDLSPAKRASRKKSRARAITFSPGTPPDDDEDDALPRDVMMRKMLEDASALGAAEGRTARELEALVLHGEDARLMDDLLFTVRYFSSPGSLISALQRTLGEGDDAARLHAGFVLSWWLKKHWYLFASNARLLSRVVSMGDALPRIARSVLSLNTVKMIEQAMFDGAIAFDDLAALKLIINSAVFKSMALEEGKPPREWVSGREVARVWLECPWLKREADEKKRREGACKIGARLLACNLLESAKEEPFKDSRHSYYTLTGLGEACKFQARLEVQSHVRRQTLKLSLSMFAAQEKCTEFQGARLMRWLGDNTSMMPDAESPLECAQEMVDLGMLRPCKRDASSMSESAIFVIVPHVFSPARFSSLVSKASALRHSMNPLSSLLDTDPTTLAASLTLLDQHFFGRLNLAHLDHTAWKTATSETSTVKRWIDSFNRISYLCATEVVTAGCPEDRRRVLKLLIRTAVRLRKRRSFSALFAVMGGLSLTPVQRLTSMWEQTFSEKKLREDYDKLMALKSSSGNYREYRGATLKEGPCIPYIGLVLQDLLRVEEIPTAMDTETFNERKLFSIARIKHHLRDWQETSIPLLLEDRFDDICTYVASEGVALDPETLYKLSKKLSK